ncbi:hypothetical protein IAU60_005171 [Kwoniella sp. DSM 27419]
MSTVTISSSSEAGPSTPRKEVATPSTPPSSSPKVSKKQTVDQLRDGLAQLGLDTKGKKETLWRRLVSAVHRASLRDPPSDESDSESDHDITLARGSDGSTSIRVLKQRYTSFLCFDVEATCRPGKEFDWPNEIIEFPVVLLRWTDLDASGKRKLERIDHFRSYVRPTWSPILTNFCKDLTGITQETVDKAPTFPQMLKKFEKWLDKWDLRTDKGLKDALWVTDGPWDLRDFVPKQLHITPTNPHPAYFHGPYLNLKFAVQAVLSESYRRDSYAASHSTDPPNVQALSPITTQKTRPVDKTKGGKAKDVTRSFYFNIPGMVEALNLGEFEGRQHSGLDDASNIARILIALSKKDVIIEANGRIQPLGSDKRYPWMGKRGEVLWEEWMSTNVESGKPTSGGVAEARQAMKPESKEMSRPEVTIEGSRLEPEQGRDASDQVLSGEKLAIDKVTLAPPVPTSPDIPARA